VILDGEIHVVDGNTANWTVVDPTGTGLGWHVNIDASDFVDEEGHTISVEAMSLKVAQENIQLISGSGIPNTLISSFSPLSQIPQTVLSANLEEGMGTFEVTPEFRLSIAPSTYAGHYVSTITVSIISGP
jgi:hypothetical protein